MEKENNQREKSPKEPTITFDRVADFMRDRNYFFSMSDTHEFYIYENGVYVNDGSETKMKRLARATYKRLYAAACDAIGFPVPVCIKEPGKKYTEEVLEKLRIDTAISRSTIDRLQRENIRYINLKNGIYDRNTKQLLKHSPKFISTQQIPVAFDKDAACPNLSKFLSEVVSEADRVVLEEFAGYCLIPNTRIQKAILLFGDGSNGKSVFLILLSALIGDSNVSHESLQKLEEDKFSVANIYGKLVNLYADLKDSIIEHDDVFKMIVGGDTLRGERKYQHSFEFHNTARLIFSANTQNLPKLRKDDFAFYRRWILIHFVSQFLEPGENPDAKRDDKKLLSRLTTETELSGFLNIALEGLERVIQNEKYSYDKSIGDVERIYKLNSSSVSTFAERCLMPSTEDTEKDEMYRDYCAWAAAVKVKCVPANIFGKEMKRLGYTSDRPYDPILRKKLSVWEDVVVDKEKLSVEVTGKKYIPECFRDEFVDDEADEIPW